MEEAVARAATESTATAEPRAATAVRVVAEHALESAPSESVAAVEVETSRLPTHRTMPIEVARRSSDQVVYPAPKLKTELVNSVACRTHLWVQTSNLSRAHSPGSSGDAARE